jgi:hypothetical protein
VAIQAVFFRVGVVVVSAFLPALKGGFQPVKPGVSNLPSIPWEIINQYSFFSLIPTPRHEARF